MSGPAEAQIAEELTRVTDTTEGSCATLHYPFLGFLLRLATANAFTRAMFFKCFFLVFRSFSRPVAIISPNRKKWKRSEPLALALCESV